MLIDVDNQEGYPTGWIHYCNYIRNIKTTINPFGFVSNNGDVNRFAARFRAANCFDKLCIEGYTDITCLGYSALCHVVFTWSAFETFLKIIGETQKSITKKLEEYNVAKVLKQIKDIDRELRFYNFIYVRVNQTHKSELENFFAQESCNITYLASAIRHIFAHGWLSPNTNKVNPSNVIKICNILCQFLLKFMDEEFHTRIIKSKLKC